LAESAEFVTGVDEHGKPANISAGLDKFGRLTLLKTRGPREVHLTPESAARFLKIVRETNIAGWLSL